jgi:hypothetical protein
MDLESVDHTGESRAEHHERPGHHAAGSFAQPSHGGLNRHHALHTFALKHSAS